MNIPITISKKELFGERGPVTVGEKNLWAEIVAARWIAGFKITFWIAIGAVLVKYLIT